MSSCSKRVRPSAATAGSATEARSPAVRSSTYSPSRASPTSHDTRTCPSGSRLAASGFRRRSSGRSRGAGSFLLALAGGAGDGGDGEVTRGDDRAHAQAAQRLANGLGRQTLRRGELDDVQLATVRYALRTAGQTQLQALERAVDGFDFDTAIMLMDELSRTADAPTDETPP